MKKYLAYVVFYMYVYNWKQDIFDEFISPDEGLFERNM